MHCSRIYSWRGFRQDNSLHRAHPSQYEFTNSYIITKCDILFCSYYFPCLVLQTTILNTAFYNADKGHWGWIYGTKGAVSQKSFGSSDLYHWSIRRKGSLCVCINVCVYTWLHVQMSLLWVRIGERGSESMYEYEKSNLLQNIILCRSSYGCVSKFLLYEPSGYFIYVSIRIWDNWMNEWMNWPWTAKSYIHITWI
jgi:hypothetical protein